MRTGFLKKYSNAIVFIVRIIDILLILISANIAFYFKFNSLVIPVSYWVAILSSATIAFFIFPIFKVYNSHRGYNPLSYIKRLFLSVMIVALSVTAASFALKFESEISRVWLFLWVFILFTSLVLSRVIIYLILYYMRAHGLNQRRVILIGAGELALEMVQRISHSLWTGFHIVAIYDDFKQQAADPKQHLPAIEKYPADITEKINKLDADEVWLALPLHAVQRTQEILNSLKHEVVTTRQILDFYAMKMVNSSLTELVGMPILNINVTPMVGYNRIVKAIEDRVLAFMILVMISPLMLMIAVLIKLTSPGPVFYKQKRVSWNGKQFNILKFRSMTTDAERQTSAIWAVKNDPRTTRLGAFLRKTSLDELPQFINVLKGDMSIVGPRPERPEFINKFKYEIPNYMQKHLVKAGITGWAQVNGWRGNTDLQKRIEYDLYYIESWSLLFDLKIIFLTIFKGFINKNAY